MPHFDNHGVNIYYEIEGQGDTVVLLHGITSNLNSWRQVGLVDLLKTHYQVVLIDVRGHGKSDKFVEPKYYKIKDMAADVDNLLAFLHIEKANIYGFSMGGFIGMAMYKYYSKRVKSLIIAGASPTGLSTENRQVLEGVKQLFDIGVKGGGPAFVAYFKEQGAEMVPFQEARDLAATPQDFQAFEANIIQALQNPIDFRGTVRASTVPILMYVGDQDDLVADLIQNGAQEYPNVEFVILPNQSHDTCYGSELSFSIVSDFLASLD